MSEFARENDEEMSLDEPEVEIEDADGLMKQLENHIQESKMRNDEMDEMLKNIITEISKLEIHIQKSKITNGKTERVLQKLKDNISAQEELNRRQAAIEADAGSYSEKLSQTAVELIRNIEGTLTPDNFSRFLMNDAFGKPNPSVLPILRKFTPDVEGFKKQLIDFKTQLKSKHKDYKEERRKEENLERRIERLIDNIEKELKVETRDGRIQTSMDNFMRGGYL